MAEILAIGLAVNVPIMGFGCAFLWKLDTRLVRVETKLDAVYREVHGKQPS